MLLDYRTREPYWGFNTKQRREMRRCKRIFADAWRESFNHIDELKQTLTYQNPTLPHESDSPQTDAQKQ